MDEKSISDLLAQFFPDAAGENLQTDKDQADDQSNLLAEGLKAIVGQSGGALGTAVNEFLSGQGALHETTRTALTRSSASAASEIATFLTTQFKLPPVTANLIAPLLVKLVPSIGKGTQKESPPKARPRRKVKPKTTSTSKTAASRSKKRPVKKTTTSSKTSSSKTKAKKKPASRVAKKRTATARKPTKAKRTETLDVL